MALAETERVRQISKKLTPRYDKDISVFETLLFSDWREIMPIEGLATDIEGKAADTLVRKAVGQDDRDRTRRIELPGSQTRTDAGVLSSDDEEAAHRISVACTLGDNLSNSFDILFVVSVARVATRTRGANPAEFLRLLAHGIRWRLLRELSRSDRRVNELVALVGIRPNLVSYHLAVLRKHRLVSERRSSADARDVYYRFEHERFRTGFLASGSTLDPAFEGEAEGSRSERVVSLERPTSRPKERVLFLCTGNSARSQMAEGILRHLTEGSIDVESAGTRPRGVNPLAVKALEPTIDISHQRSKHLDAFIDQRFDYVITLCDRAREECPIFPGHPERIHWSFPDPAEVEGKQEREAAFRRTASELFTRLRYLIAMIERKRQRS